MFTQALEIESSEELQLSGIIWNRCGCGELKPKKGNCCWRCIERDVEFVRLDALIAAGYGSIQQSLIPKEIMLQFTQLAYTRFEPGRSYAHSHFHAHVQSHTQLAKSA
jgi:hypothetical protein